MCVCVCVFSVFVACLLTGCTEPVSVSCPYGRWVVCFVITVKTKVCCKRKNKEGIGFERERSEISRQENYKERALRPL